jgi:Fructose-1,6-bisphosphatase/sedoheptulose 1,7-bisphosphatase and related proteins
MVIGTTPETGLNPEYDEKTREEIVDLAYAVLTAAALRGKRYLAVDTDSMQMETAIERAQEQGIDDMEQIFAIEDLASTEVIVAATGVSNGDLLRGVRFLADSARTHSLVMCTRCNWVRFIDGTHFFARERREEVRLL